MGVVRKICGYETGRTDADYTLVGTPTIVAGAARTGNYGLKDKKTVASIAGCSIIPSTVTIPSGALFAVSFRFFFQPEIFPSASNYVLGEFANISCRLEMSSAGLLRLNSTLEAASAYSGQTQIGHWYEAQLLIAGYNKEGVVVNSARTRFVINVFDWGLDGEGDGSDPQLLVTFATSHQTTVNQANINCDGPSGEFGISGDAIITMKSKVIGYKLNCIDAGISDCGVPCNGEYSNFTSETNALGPEGGVPCIAPCTATNGGIIESGSLNGVNIQYFKKGNSAIGNNPDFTVGQSAGSGVSCTREINYDDVYIEIVYDTDVAFEFAGAFPISTHVRPFPVIAQGFYDLFAPIGAFDRVQAIPMVDTLTVTAALLNAATSYVHDLLDDFDMVEHIRVYARLNGTALAQSLIVFEDPSDLTFLPITVPAVNGGVYGDVPLENDDAILGADFNLIEYGIILDNAGTVNLHSIFIEVLTGEADIVLDGPTPGGAMIEGGLNLGDLGITTGSLILITDGSGLYSITVGQFFDELYARNATDATVNVQIPDPFFKTFFAGG